MQFQIGNSPFNQEQTELLNQLLLTLTDSQKIWLSGYLAGSMPKHAENQSIRQTGTSKKEVTVLYGSQTGNAQGIARKAGETLKKYGFQVTVSAMNDFKTNQIKKVKNLLLIVSTHGEGEPPDNAILFHQFLFGKRAPKLENLQYSVLSLGDSSYEFFCQVGKELDSRLEEIGGIRLYPRFDCDLDFEEPASEWLNGVIRSLKENENSVDEPRTISIQSVTESNFSRSNPYNAEVLENINLNGRGSNKETRHLELSLEGSGLIYKPGDSLGIYPENDPDLVEMLLNELKWSPEETVSISKHGDILSLKEALTSHFEITVLTKSLLQKAAELSKEEKLQELLSQDDTLKSYLEGRDLLDLVRDFGYWGDTPQDFVSILRKMPPRLYSIASSSAANPNEVHLTIGTVRYTANGRERKGVCSCFTAERLEPGEKLRVFIQENSNFKLPENPNTAIIMIGPGTGVAPFRAFMQEREEIGAEGKSWLFFGAQHFITDFLYQTEWKQWFHDGILTKMDVAFSRDTKGKVYVQHRMLEHSQELFAWLEEGAVVYICGDEKRMAKDVHCTLVEIIAKEGNLSHEDAEQYLARLRQNNRYQRDVY